MSVNVAAVKRAYAVHQTTHFVHMFRISQNLEDVKKIILFFMWNTTIKLTEFSASK